MRFAHPRRTTLFGFGEVGVIRYGIVESVDTGQEAADHPLSAPQQKIRVQVSRAVLPGGGLTATAARFSLWKRGPSPLDIVV